LKTSSCGQRINWLNVRWVQVRKEEPRSIFVNYSFKEDGFLELKIQGSTRGRRQSQVWLDTIPCCYDSRLPI